jgi:hypothetical protein
MTLALIASKNMPKPARMASLPLPNDVIGQPTRGTTPLKSVGTSDFSTPGRRDTPGRPSRPETPSTGGPG